MPWKRAPKLRHRPTCGGMQFPYCLRWGGIRQTSPFVGLCFRGSKLPREFLFAALPRPLDSERSQALSLALVQAVLDQAVDATAARPTAQAGSQVCQVALLSRCHHLNFALLGVAHPSAQIH